MARDLTSTPFKHLLAQSAVLVLMAAAACLVVTLNPWIALPINFIMIFLILYLYTYEYSGHLYFPYILSYLFLIFISPSSPEQLPKRIMAMVTGAVCIILYQLVMGRNQMCIRDRYRRALPQRSDRASPRIRWDTGSLHPRSPL